jgi:hypothetical protein
MPLDLVVARDSLEMVFLERARVVDIGGLKVPMITPEDLVIAKLFAHRPRDLEDVRAVLGTMRDAMDLRHVRACSVSSTKPRTAPSCCRRSNGSCERAAARTDGASVPPAARSMLNPGGSLLRRRSLAGHGARVDPPGAR